MRIAYGLALGQGRVTLEALEGLRERLLEAQQWLEEEGARGEVGFMDLPLQDPSPVLQVAREVRNLYDHFVLIGIGGSSLGAQTLFDALRGPSYNRHSHPTFHILDNVDPVKVEKTMSEVKIEATCFCVVSKSGSTAESMANFLVALGLLQRAVGREEARKRIVFITDPHRGTLRELAREEGYRSLDIPSNVGGRFSVLSPVGLFPAAVLGIDVKRLLEGASRALEACKRQDSVTHNPAWLIAGLHYLYQTLEHRGISVMMAYHERLSTFVDWYRQLWAESLGKDGKGQTPVKAIGAVDQHSQIQLYNEGPRDKVITFLQVENFALDHEIPHLYPHKPALAYLGRHRLGELLKRELIGTASALAKRGVPSITITLPKIDEACMGALFMVYEMATALSGYLYGINPFDQPGVEEGKQLTYGLMGREGYQDKGYEAQKIWEKSIKASLIV